MLKCIRNNTFSITFDNGFTINVMFSKMHSCDRKDKNNSLYEDVEAAEISCKNAEVSITDNKGKVVLFDTETTLINQSPKQIAELIFKTSIAKFHSDVNDFNIELIERQDEWM